MPSMPKRIRPKVYTNFAEALNDMGSRRQTIEANTEARAAYKADEGNQLKRRVRAASVAVTQLDNEASRQWHAIHDPVPAPAAIGSVKLHPTRVAVLVEFVLSQGWSDDPTQPVAPAPTMEEIDAAVAANARQELADANAAYAAYEAGRYADDDETETVEPVAMVDEAPSRPRARQPKMQLDPGADVVPEA